MNATELFHQDGKTAGVFYCGKCRVVHKTKESADQCCDKRCACGAQIGGYEVWCHDCWDRYRNEREQKRFEAAQKIPTKDYVGWVYADGCGWNNGYFESVEAFLDWWEENSAEGDEKPVYVWACTENNFAHIDLDDLLQQIEENAYEDFDSESLEALDQLKAAIKAFNTENKNVVSYDSDYKRAILL